jgi:hypothetical protein
MLNIYRDTPDDKMSVTFEEVKELYKEMMNERSKERWRTYDREYKLLKYHTDPEYREKKKLQTKQRREKKKAEAKPLGDS